MTTTYKSPAYKLVKFFENSRDQWKSKYTNKKVLLLETEKQLKEQHSINEKLLNKIEMLEHSLKEEKKIIK